MTGSALWVRADVGTDLFSEVAKSMNVPVQEDMKPFKTNLETIVFDPKNPAAYIAAAKQKPKQYEAINFS